MSIHTDVTRLADLSDSQFPARIKDVGDRPASAPPTIESRSLDSAQVSHAAHLAEQAMQLPEVRAEKVAGIQKALADGSYHIEATELAQSIMKSMSTGNEVG